jgi:hypothetical protein
MQTENVSIKKRTSLMDKIREKQNDQDFMQKANVASTLMLELYRVLMGAFLVIFVPQKCGDAICSISENANRDDALSKAGIAFNTLTMFSFLMLYLVEVKRENKLINYLEVNKFTPVDNESVGNALEKLAINKKENIWNYDKYYMYAGYLSTGSFILNAIISSIVVYSNYLDSKTVTVYLTNLLFMGLKVSDVYNTVNTNKNIFYSAYLKNKVQFNDVDPDKMIDLSKNNILNIDIEENKDETELENVVEIYDHFKNIDTVKINDNNEEMETISLDDDTETIEPIDSSVTHESINTISNDTYDEVPQIESVINQIVDTLEESESPPIAEGEISLVVETSNTSLDTTSSAAPSSEETLPLEGDDNV